MALISSVIGATAGVTNLVQKGGSVIALGLATKALLKPDTEVEGIDGLLFAIPLTESLAFQAQITDHVVEDNSVMQDHIAISPIKITLTGMVSELVLTKSKIEAYAETVLNTLGSLDVLSPSLSQSAASALSTATRAKQAAEQILSKAKNISDILKGNPTKTKQQEFYLDLKQKFFGRGLYTVQTPWETLKNMAIESLSFDQDESTKEWTTINITLKQITLAQTKKVKKELKGRIKNQKADKTKKGPVKGKSVLKKTVPEAVQQVKKIFTGG